MSSAVELVKASHLGVLIGQPVGENPHRLDPGVCTGGTQHGADGLGITDDLPANRGLRDESSKLGRSASWLGYAPSRRAGREAELKADLTNSEQARERLGAR